MGGLETFGYNILKNFRIKNKETYSIVNKKGNKNLPFFFVYSLIKSLHIINAKEIEAIYLSDGILSPFGVIIKKLTNKKIAITLHGKEVTYNNKIYQKIMSNLINKLDLVLCVSNQTKKEAIKIGVDERKVYVTNNGINPLEFLLNKPKSLLKNKLFSKFRIQSNNRKILFTNGRLVKRKGVR